MKHERFTPSHQRMPWAGTRRVVPGAGMPLDDCTVVPGEAELIETFLGAAITELFGGAVNHIAEDER